MDGGIAHHPAQCVIDVGDIQTVVGMSGGHAAKRKAGASASRQP
jgi:hypothetical protein